MFAGPYGLLLEIAIFLSVLRRYGDQRPLRLSAALSALCPGGEP
jgi:hypothetical protein